MSLMMYPLINGHLLRDIVDTINSAFVFRPFGTPHSLLLVVSSLLVIDFHTHITPFFLCRRYILFYKPWVSNLGGTEQS